jgi:hypothetical protein
LLRSHLSILGLRTTDTNTIAITSSNSLLLTNLLCSAINPIS